MPWREKLTRNKDTDGGRRKTGAEEATVILPPLRETAAQAVQSPEGLRTETAKPAGWKRHKKVLLGLAGLVAVLLAGYLVLCGTVCQGVMLPNTAIGGKSVSGMTVAEATQVAETVFADHYADLSLTVQAAGKDYTVAIGNALDLNAADAAQEAYDYGHGAFFSRGMVWLLACVGGNDKNVLPRVSEEAVLEENIAASGVLKADTAVADAYKLSEEEITFTKGTSGQAADQEQLLTAVRRAAEQGAYDQVLQCPMTDSAPKALDMDQVYEETYAEPVNATLDPEQDYAVVDGVQGIQFDKEAAKTAVAGLKEGASASVALTRTDPEITTENLKSNLFKDQLGTYSTNVSGTAARLSNVRLAAQHCNDTILLADQVFSYNDTVGQRTAARGFQKAGAYLNGVTVQELGGGVCQVSSTLYSATVLSNLEIVKRQNHTYESTYIPLGMDATVSWGGPDYQFKNNTAYPIKVVASYSGGVLTCQIWGTKTDDITVKFTHEVLSTIQYGTVKKENSSMKAGTSVVSVTGETGYKVQSYRELYDGNGTRISKNKEAYSVYSKRDQVVLVGTKSEEKKEDTDKKNDKKNDKKKSDSGKKQDNGDDEKKTDQSDENDGNDTNDETADGETAGEE